MMTLLNRMIKDIKANGTLSNRDVGNLVQAGILEESDQFELINGEIVPMAAAKYSLHEAFKNAAVRELVIGLNRLFTVGIESSLFLADSTMVEPDIAVWPPGLESADVRAGDLLLLIEVADSTLSFDLKTKAGIYGRLGVLDYWVIDVNRRQIVIHRDPSETGYKTRLVGEADEEVKPLFLDLTICLNKLV
jgi:Uma2 family endonuclease